MRDSRQYADYMLRQIEALEWPPLEIALTGLA